MAEVDYQMALLLQHCFEQEQKALKNAQKSDEALARQLQEQFEQEEAIEKPPLGLVYKSKTSPNSSKSLVDPSWELVDPTPDIHTLFMVFNERFFWNQLLAVCVSWSKRMTSCAGICSYNGRGGMCSITLSEPLLKLRPRKDLVETLLHEMIHAFLFVTHNNKDRDGHGPEFHKHMYRINKESGTNITVYHNFHDEVRMYQQHWWRCNGPCQRWKPYFGMVRRATNRAPGPYDRWWGEHQRNCGGTFIKVKQPEKAEKTDAKTSKNKDIRDFLTPQSNITTFKDLGSQVKGKFNSSSTMVPTKNSKPSESSFEPSVFNPESQKSVVPSQSLATDAFVSVRNHWANKFPSKRPSLDQPSSSSAKIPKTSSTDDCECPSCSQKVPLLDLNSHLDFCLLKDNIPDAKEEEKECPLCNIKVKSSAFDLHVEKCIMDVYNGIEDQLQPETVSCLACGEKILKSALNSHLEDCMVHIFDVSKTEIDNLETGKNGYNCPFCLEVVEEKVMKEHIDRCLGSDNNVVEALLDDF